MVKDAVLFKNCYGTIFFFFNRLFHVYIDKSSLNLEKKFQRNKNQIYFAHVKLKKLINKFTLQIG